MRNRIITFFDFVGMKTTILPLTSYLLPFNVNPLLITVPMFQPLSSVWGPLLRAVWCHSVPGVARLLQRLPELWVGHWGWTRKLHQDQFWQVCMTVLQQLSCEEQNRMYTLTNSKLWPPFHLWVYMVCFILETNNLKHEIILHNGHCSFLCQRKSIKQIFVLHH